ncbi:MAG: deoxyribodipyrimidine photo-lyase [Candidatus Thorarchaeota archaeon]|nr:MAG: deoxyribodipyrimidine photo-lyase [Candidatus Thorarchaeota archaeon]
MQTIQEDRIKHMNDQDVQDGKYVLYWMQASQRTEYNHSLEYAIEKANKLNRSLLVYFNIIPDFPSATERSYHFMLQGLREVDKALEARNIEFLVKVGQPIEEIKELSKDSSLIVLDRDYQRTQKQWREKIASSVRCRVIQVETNVLVPVETAYAKEAYSAGILRPNIHRNLERFLKPVSERSLNKLLQHDHEGVNLRDTTSVLELLQVDESVARVKHIVGGTTEAKRRLSDFIKHQLDEFHILRNDPSKDYLSGMSPYLHFGQISPLFVALQIADSKKAGADAYLEELIVRRELSMNFAHFNPSYDSYDCLPEWAKITLQKHADDTREYTYTRRQLENSETHDSYWNAAQTEMTRTGKMHGYMRMYWGKKIIEWTRQPKSAYRIALYLNDKFELDGRDPNGYAGVAWCFGKHDRAWAERPIFGKVRFMSAKGLERKFEIEEYVRKVLG